MNQDEIVSLLASHQNITQLYSQLELKCDNLQQQLDWFKRQLFGSKSERHITEDESRQLTLGEFGQTEPANESVIKVPSHERRIKSSRQGAGEGDLRFDDSVPVEQIMLPSSIADADLDDYEIIGEKKNRHLAQKTGSYFVKEFIRTVTKRRPLLMQSKMKLFVARRPGRFYYRSFADVSLLVSILIEKFRYHLPLYRQYQRMTACGVNIARGILTNWVHRTCELLVPIYGAQLRSILLSKVLAMDEIPTKAGRKKNIPSGKGKMSTACFGPL